MKTQSSLPSLRRTLKVLFGIFAFWAFLAISSYATNDDPEDAYCPYKDCEDCGEVYATVPTGTTCPAPGSLSWAMKVGVARYARQGSFVNSARGGALEGSVRDSLPRDFDQILKTMYGSGSMNRQGVNLELNVLSINEDVFDPSILGIYSTGDFIRIDDQGHIRQVLTDNGFTDIEKLPGSGFHIRFWDRQGLSLTKTGNFYDLPSLDPVSPRVPVNEVIFQKPDGYTGNDELLMISTERFGARGAHVTTQHYIEDEIQDTLVVTTYEGAGVSGTPIHKQILQKSNRGTKKWDYTIERQVFQANTDASGNMSGLVKIAHAQEIYKDFSSSEEGGEVGARRMMSNTKDFGGANLQTVYTYYEQPGQKYIHGRLKSVLNPDQSWVYHEYTDTGGATVTAVKYSPWKDVTLSNYQNGLKEETIIGKNSFTRTLSIGGQQISQSKTTKQVDDATGESTLTSEKWTGSEWATEIVGYYPEGVTGSNPAECAGRPKWIEHADGTATVYTYTKQGLDLVISEKKGAGDRTGITEGYEKVSTFNTNLLLKSEQTKDIASGLTLNSKVADQSFTINDLAALFPAGEVSTTDSNMVSGFDGLGRAIKWIYNGNSADFSVSARGCCGPKYSRDRSGAINYNHRDRLRRVYHSTTQSSSTDTPIHTHTTFTGLTTTTTREAGGVTLFVSEITETLSGLSMTRKSPDADGDAVSETATRVTTYPGTGGRVTTITHPDTTTTSSTTFIDGSMKTSSDELAKTTTYDKGTHNEQGGGLWRQSTAANGTQWTKSYTDHLGRRFKTEYPDGALATQAYHPFSASAGSRGKLAATTDPDENANLGTGSSVTYAYNDEGELLSVTEALPDGQQRLTVTESDVVNDPFTGSAFRTRQTVNGVLVSTSLRSGDGYRSKSITLSGTSTSERTVPVDGAWTITRFSADGQKSVQTYTNGQIQKTEVFDNQNTPVLIASSSATYDAFDRTLTTTDSRTGATTINGYLENGASTSVTTNGGADTTSFTYDKMGRRTVVTLPDTSATHKTYTARGEVETTYGSQAYPRVYSYDDLGRMNGLRTKPTLDSSGVPTNAGGSLTTWSYDPQRGWLVEKNYDGESGNGPGNAADYTYTLSGRLKTRTWERGITTTYGYDQGSLDTVVYSDSTTDLAYTYDNFGRPLTVTQGGNTHIYSYDPTKLSLDQESIAYDLDKDGTDDFTRILDHSQDTLLRPSGFSLKDAATTEHAVSYGYDNAGRLKHIHPSATLPATPDFTYGYEPNSFGLVKTVTSPVHSVTNTYEASRNVLSNKENNAGGTIPSNFAYTVNNLGQRTNLTTSGTAFATAPAYTWAYNTRGELIQADDSSANNDDRAYQYDAIGNREKTVNGLLAALPASPNYQANSLNQYTIVPGVTASPVYDSDGNAEAYPVPKDPTNNAQLSWDAENRLIASTVNGLTTTYQYDYQSRRIAKTTNGTTTTTIYQGWNPIAEYTGSALDKTYTWGMDLSGSMQGAGGVGGLLSVSDGSGIYYPTYDGNGNVSEYLDGTGAVQAHYEYDAFGNTIASTGAKKNDFSHRFSTKPLDDETGLYYYGYRYYDPVTGRWPSRDPLGLNWNTGEFNVYAFVNNFPIKVVDNLGLQIANGNGNKTGDEDKNKVGYEASRAAAELTKKHKDKLEYCGLVCCKKGKYQKTPPVEGTIKTTPIGDSIETKHTCKPHEKGSCEKQLGEGWKTVGWYHSHPDGADNFSDGDFNYTWPYEDDDRDFDGYMGNTDGDVFKLEVTSEEITNEYGTGIVNTGETSSVDENGNEGPSAPSHPRN